MSAPRPSLRDEPQWAELDVSRSEIEWDAGDIDLEAERPWPDARADRRSWAGPIGLGVCVLVGLAAVAVGLVVEPSLSLGERRAAAAPPASVEAAEAPPASEPAAPPSASPGPSPDPSASPAPIPRPVALGGDDPVLASGARIHRAPPPPEFIPAPGAASPIVRPEPSAAPRERASAAKPRPEPAAPSEDAPAKPDAASAVEPPLPGADADEAGSPSSPDELPAPTNIYADLPEYPS